MKNSHTIKRDPKQLWLSSATIGELQCICHMCDILVSVDGDILAQILIELIEYAYQ
jgi:hypothetical protein